MAAVYQEPTVVGQFDMLEAFEARREAAWFLNPFGSSTETVAFIVLVAGIAYLVWRKWSQSN